MISKRVFIEDSYNIKLQDDLSLKEYSKRESNILEQKLISNFEGIEERNIETDKDLSELKSNLDYKINYLEGKIQKAVEKLRGSILVERNTTTAIYTDTIRIEEYNKEKTTARVKDSIVFGISDTRIEEQLVTPLSSSDLNIKTLSIKSLNSDSTLKNFSIENRETNNIPLEFSIDLRNKVNSTSSIILDLTDYSIIEVYIDDVLYKERTLSNYFNIPVDLNNHSVSFRSYPTIHRSSKLQFNVLGITKYTTSEECVYESKPIQLNKTLSKLVIDSCDNNNENSSIDYYISVNNKEYEKTKTVTKQNRLPYSLQSIIKLNKTSDSDLLVLSGNKKGEGIIEYTVPTDIQDYTLDSIDLYSRENIDYTDFYIQVIEDISLHKSIINNTKAYVDDKEAKEDLIFIAKGMRHIVLDKDTNTDKLRTILKDFNVFKTKINKTVSTRENGSKYITMTPSDLISTFKNLLVLPLYTTNLEKAIYVDTIKIKAVLKSIDKVTTPYISRLLIRGL